MSAIVTTTPRSCCGCGVDLAEGYRPGYCVACLQGHEEYEFQRRLRVSQEHIGIPKRFWDFTLAAAEQTPAIELVRAYREAQGVRQGRALGLLGPTGVGKTAAAAALMNSMIIERRFTNQRFVITASLIRRLLNFDQQAEAMEEATTARLLILDDLAQADERGRPLLEEVLITREANELPLIFTSNLTPKQLAAAFSDRIVDRLRVWGELHQVGGASLRRPSEDS